MIPPHIADEQGMLYVHVCAQRYDMFHYAIKDADMLLLKQGADSQTGSLTYAATSAQEPEAEIST